jgi:hypothetical protein
MISPCYATSSKTKQKNHMKSLFIDLLCDLFAWSRISPVLLCFFMSALATQGRQRRQYTLGPCHLLSGSGQIQRKWMWDLRSGPAGLKFNLGTYLEWLKSNTVLVAQERFNSGTDFAILRGATSWVWSSCYFEWKHLFLKNNIFINCWVVQQWGLYDLRLLKLPSSLDVSWLHAKFEEFLTHCLASNCDTWIFLILPGHPQAFWFSGLHAITTCFSIAIMIH